MAGKAGQRLSDEEVREYAAYHNNQIPLPEKFDSVVVESTLPTGAVYRYATEEELKAGRAAASASLAAAEEDAALNDKVRKEAAKRGVDLPPVPAAPDAPATLAAPSR